MCTEQHTEALLALTEAVAQGFYNDGLFIQQFQSKLDKATFNSYLAGIVENKKRHQSLVNKKLMLLFKEDQQDRVNISQKIKDKKYHAFLYKRDQRRTESVKRIIDIEGLNTAEDHYYAAMVLQHSDSKENYLLAHELCLKAIHLDPYYNAPRWLAAASLDRYLLASNQPQIFDTQFLITENNPVLRDSKQISQDYKNYWRVPPQAIQKEQIANLRQ